MKQVALVIIGGGSAGMQAALQAKEEGCDSILLLERGEELGGILEQCIHNGFGLQLFQEELSGPAFAQRLKDALVAAKIPYRTQATVIKIDCNRMVTYVHPEDGVVEIQAQAIILASGCYERNRGAISIPGKRLKGVYTAGTAQRYLNMENVLVGKRVFILGSGDIGLIMARRMSLEGAEVLGVAELMPYSNGLTRNIVQCLQDFNIPLYLSHTVINIEGKDHVEAITIAQVDEQKQAIKGSEKRFLVDTLLLSVGLIPEESLAEAAGILLDPHTKGAIVNEHLETSISHIYACGNALHVHDLVDFVCMEAKLAAHYAIQDLSQEKKARFIPVEAKDAIGYVLPQQLHTDLQEDVQFSMRVKKVMKHVEIVFESDGEIIKKVQKRVVLPAEMIRIICTQAELQKIHSNLHVKVREIE